MFNSHWIFFASDSEFRYFELTASLCWWIIFFWTGHHTNDKRLRQFEMQLKMEIGINDLHWTTVYCSRSNWTKKKKTRFSAHKLFILLLNVNCELLELVVYFFWHNLHIHIKMVEFFFSFQFFSHFHYKACICLTHSSIPIKPLSFQNLGFDGKVW